MSSRDPELGGTMTDPGVPPFFLATHYSHSGYLVYGERPYLHVGCAIPDPVSDPTSPEII